MYPCPILPINSLLPAAYKVKFDSVVTNEDGLFPHTRVVKWDLTLLLLALLLYSAFGLALIARSLRDMHK
jgi:hypothetical protein